LTAEQMQDALDEWDREDGLPVRPRERLLKQSA
jgi:hypothetical protein